MHRGGHPRRENYARRHMIDLDANWNPLRQPHPGEDRIDVGKALPIGLRVRHIDAPRNAADVPVNELLKAHQLDGGQVADVD